MCGIPLANCLFYSMHTKLLRRNIIDLGLILKARWLIIIYTYYLFIHQNWPNLSLPTKVGTGKNPGTLQTLMSRTPLISLLFALLETSKSSRRFRTNTTTSQTFTAPPKHSWTQVIRMRRSTISSRQHAQMPLRGRIGSPRVSGWGLLLKIEEA